MATVAHTKEQLTERLLRARRHVRALGVRRVCLFGSFLREEARSGSDVGLLVEFEPEQKTLDNFMALCLFLEDLLGRSVEIVSTERLTPFVGPRILDEALDILPQRVPDTSCADVRSHNP
jgi:predicted nucleotidyltransferase